MEQPTDKRPLAKVDQNIKQFANKSKKNRIIYAVILAVVLIGFYAAQYFFQKWSNDKLNNQVNQTTGGQYNP